MGAQLVKEAASKTSDAAGDGTTTATVLAEAIFKEGLKALAAGADPMALKRGIDKAVDRSSSRTSRARPRRSTARRRSPRSRRSPPTTTRSIGEKLADAFEKVGTDGVITVEEGKGFETTVDVVEGMQFDRGYLSPHFVTDPDRMEVVLEDPYILIYEEKVSTPTRPDPAARADRQGQQAAADHRRGRRGRSARHPGRQQASRHPQVAAVKAPGYGDRRKAMLGDIAVLTGGKAIFKDLGIELESIELSDLGRCQEDHSSPARPPPSSTAPASPTRSRAAPR